MHFNLGVITNEEAVQLLPEEQKQALSEKLQAAPESRLVTLAYTKPLSRLHEMQLKAFEESRFYRDALSGQSLIRYSMQSKTTVAADNPRISPREAEVARIETPEKTIVLYHGRTGVLNALGANFTGDSSFFDSHAGEMAGADSSATPAKKTTRKR